MFFSLFLQRRVLKVLLVWDNAQVFHYNVVDKMRLTFVGKTTDDMEKRKAFVSWLAGWEGGWEPLYSLWRQSGLHGGSSRRLGWAGLGWAEIR